MALHEAATSGAVATSPETVESVLSSLKSKRFSAKKMFGEYAIYADGKVVALVCDDRLFVKVHPKTESLANDCELGPPYPGAKPYYVMDEGQWMSRTEMATILAGLAAALPAPPPKKP